MILIRQPTSSISKMEWQHLLMQLQGPHIHRRIFQETALVSTTFYRDGGIFAKLFDNDSQTPDWVMGEELVAYLENFGDKAFIIKKGTSILVINGSFEETDTEYKITSFCTI